MVKRGGEFLCEASERLASLKEEVAAGRRSRFTEKKERLPEVFDESARATAMSLVCPHRSLPNQALEPTRWTGAVLLTRPLRSTLRRSAKRRVYARQRVAHL
jgi:hypothetical protein